MARYFFDHWDDDDLVRDDEGIELPGLRQAQSEAARTLAEVARCLAKQLA